MPLFDYKPAKPKKTSDPLLKNVAIQKYREIAHFWPNHVQRELIDSMVDTTSARAMLLWELTVTEFMEKGRNPKDVHAMLKAFRLMMYP
jgi:hypothetical protein